MNMAEGSSSGSHAQDFVNRLLPAPELLAQGAGACGGPAEMDLASIFAAS